MAIAFLGVERNALDVPLNRLTHAETEIVQAIRQASAARFPDPDHKRERGRRQ